MEIVLLGFRPGIYGLDTSSSTCGFERKLNIQHAKKTMFRKVLEKYLWK